jgi:hypothetical protein
MLFQYIGPDADAPPTCDFFVHHFVLNGEPVDVTDAHTIRKLMGNPSFKHEPVLVAPVVVAEPVKYSTAPNKKQSRR